MAAENARLPSQVAAPPTELPTPAQAMAAFEELSTLVASVRAPEAGAFARKGNPAGASIILRLDGQILARVTTSGAQCVSEAARQTIEILNQRTSVPRAVRKDAENAPPPVVQKPLLVGLDSERIRVSLELAGPLVPFAPLSFDDVDRELSPGLDGVGARFGDNVSLVFPGTMLTMNLAPGDALASAIAGASGDAGLGVRGNPEAEPGVLAKARGATFFRFRTIHLANPDEGVPPIFLFRGGRVVREREVITASLAAFADSMARNLIARRTSDGAMVGTPLPTLGRFETGSASQAERALAALALARYAEGRATPASEVARSRAREILERLASEPGDAAKSFACSALAFAAAGSLNTDRAEGAIENEALRAFMRACHERLLAGSGAMSAVPEGERSLVAFALGRHAAQTKNAEDVRVAEAAAAAVLSSTTPAQLVSQMPWIGWAELAIADAKGAPVGSAAALREVRDAVYAHALSADAAGPDRADMAGGIVFSTAGAALPTWQSARPLAFLATMLGDARLTDAGEVVKEQARLLPSLRFLMQLNADDAVGQMSLRPREARGGIRAAVWDQRQPADATSLTLLTVCEALRSLDRK